MEKFDTPRNVILLWSRVCLEKAIVTQSDEEFPPCEFYGTVRFIAVSGGAFGRGTPLQAGRSRVLFPMVT